MKTLEELFLSELADIYDAERCIVAALPKMARAASGEELKQTLLVSLDVAKDHVTKVEQVFRCFDTKARGQSCKAARGILEEADAMMIEFQESPVIDIALIAAAQKLEHHAIASYWCLHAWASALGNTDAAGLLLEILEEEKATNSELSAVALAGSNEDALTGDEEEYETEVSSRRKRSVVSAN